MSWDIIIFNSKQKITSIEEVDQGLFVPVDFNTILEGHFKNIRVDVGTMLFNLYGEKALFELIELSKIHNWQIFDTGNGEMIDLEHPENNGYNNFQNYLQQILNKPK